MFAVVFEVQPKPEQWNAYLEIAKGLKPLLESMEGFIHNERFRSLSREGRVLSLSTWADEKALVRWRTMAQHHAAQRQGRLRVFEDYHLRVGEVTADTHVPAGQALPRERFDTTETAQAKLLTITEFTMNSDQGLSGQDIDLARRAGLPSGRDGPIDSDVFESILAPRKLLLLAAWSDVTAGQQWAPFGGSGPFDTFRHWSVRVIRDYGMFDRREAPQFYPAVDPGRKAADGQT